jgi:hypothetical protein
MPPTGTTSKASAGRPPCFPPDGRTASFTEGRTGLCLDPHDLCLAKLVAHREKDLVFVASLIEAGLIDPAVLAARVEDMHTADPRSRATIRQYLTARLGDG